MPESNKPTTAKRLTRGTMPSDDGVPTGRITVIALPSLMPSCLASSTPTTTPESVTCRSSPCSWIVTGCGLPISAKLPLFRKRATSTTSFACSGSTPRTKTPVTEEP